MISWVTALGSVVADGGDGWLPLTLSLAYPVGDLVLGDPRAARARPAAHAPSAPRLVVLALGLGGLAVADSAYVYLVSLEKYSSADLISTGWVIGFLLVGRGRADRAARAPTTSARRPVAAHPDPRRSGVPSVLRLSLPYLPLLGAVVGPRSPNRITGPAPRR